jgi:glyoxylase-like metal-dependent hydrolase (beta-lactamase superfamily II)
MRRQSSRRTDAQMINEAVTNKHRLSEAASEAFLDAPNEESFASLFKILTGSVVIKPAYGHTPGHSVLSVKLAKTGPVLLSGDLYHYPEEIALDRYPTFQSNKEQTRQARANIQAFMKTIRRQTLDPARPGCIREAQEGTRLLRVIRRCGACMAMDLRRD